MENSAIQKNLEIVKDAIFNAEQKSLRKSGSVKLCAVSKFHPQEAVIEALCANQFLFGENRVQEAYSKFTLLPEQYKKSAELHIIGNLQLNKIKKAVEIAQCIQSVDREEVLVEIEKHCAKIDKVISVFLELHTGEESKSGYKTEESIFSSLENCANGKYPHIKPIGFMTMAPFTNDEVAIRKSFSTTRELLEKSKKHFPNLSLTELSMGMSADYTIAIEEGSTLVRIGTAIFGNRE